MTNIEWCDETWNPVVGCGIVSPGCTNCYAMKQAARIEVMHHGQHMRAGGGAPFSPSHYAGLTQDGKAGPVWTGKVAMVDDHALTKPLRWKRGREIFVNSMGDLFHESVPDAWIDRVFAVMALAPQHTFVVLTKRAKRMREFCSDPRTPERIAREILEEHPVDRPGQSVLDVLAGRARKIDVELCNWPLPHVYLGVSAERQQEADERIPDLLATPAAGRFVSAEPLLGPIDFSRIPAPVPPEDRPRPIHALFYHEVVDSVGGCAASVPGLDGVIGGGESGPGARPMHPDWPRSIREQCAAAGVPFFFKQWGEFSPGYDRDVDDPDWRQCRQIVDNTEHSQWLNLAGGQGFHGERVVSVARVGKKAAGRLLDGREHNDLPWRRADLGAPDEASLADV